MQEIQQLRKIAVKLGTSGTAIPIAETRLYKGGYGFVVLQCYVPITQNRSPATSPLCAVFRSAVDKFGNRKQFNKDIYNMLYVNNTEIENAKYMVFECQLPKAFTDTVGELEMVFTYSEVNTDNKAATRLASGIYKTNVGDSDVSDGETVDPVGGELARLNDMTIKVEQLEYSVDALLQPPDCTNAYKVGVPNISLTEDGRLKFDELKGEKGDSGELRVGVVKQVGYDKPPKIENSGTATDAVLDFDIPQGKPAFVKIGKVVTLPPETQARVVNVGTENDPIFDFYIPEGIGLRADITYPSIEAMNSGFATDGVRLNGFALIVADDVENKDNGKLYIKTDTEYKYLAYLCELMNFQDDEARKAIDIERQRAKDAEGTLQDNIAELSETVYGIATEIETLKCNIADNIEKVNALIERLDNLNISDMLGTTPIGDASSPIYYNGTSFVEITPTFEKSDWESIANVCNLGYAQKYFNVGDEKTITLTNNEEITLVVMGFNHDELSDGSGKANITIGMKNLLADKLIMYSEDKNIGLSNTDMYKTHLPNLFNKLPIALKKIIKLVNKKAIYGGSGMVVSAQSNLFLYSAAEIYSEKALNIATIDGTPLSSYKQEGTQYEYFKNLIGDALPFDENVALLKYLNNGIGDTDVWWLRTIDLRNTQSYAYIAKGWQWEGKLWYGAAHNLGGICFAFCI